MKKKGLSLLLLAFLCLVGSSGAQEASRLTFGVISDTHFENNTGEGAMVKVPRALRNLTSQATLDALVDVGDIVNVGTSDEYAMLNRVFGDASNYTNPVGELIFVMGGHEYLKPAGDALSNYQQGLKTFNGGEPYPLDQYKVIKGYPFITVAMRNSNAQDTSSPSAGLAVYPTETQEWLRAALDRASQECPGKPIFVFTHIPPRWTVYGSWPEFESGNAWCMKVLNPILNKYPQVVLFAGHSHYPIGDPRSIHQGTHANSPHQNYYTVINTGSTTYSEVNPGVVDAGIHPENFQYVTEGLILSELENGDFEIRRYDTYRNLEIGAERRWVLKAPFDGSQFQYADLRDADDNPNNVPLRDGLPAPSFAEEDAITVEASSYSAKLTIPQAADDECVFRYRIRSGKGGMVTEEKFVFSQFYLNADMPKTLTYRMSELKPSTEYRVEVVAYDSYDNMSQSLVVSFKTPEVGGTESSQPDAQWTFDTPEDLLRVSSGSFVLQPIAIGKKSVTVKERLDEVGITAAEGTTDSDGAAFIPKNAGFKVVRPNGGLTNDWTVLMDVKMKDAAAYNSLIQTNKTNSNDGDLFVYRNQIGMGAMGGYFGKIQNGTWYRIALMNRNGTVHVYVDGVLTITCAGEGRWEIDPWGFYLFCDEDGEMSDTYVSEVAYWERSLSEDEVRALSGLAPQEVTPEEPYARLLTPSVRVTDDLDFTITVEANEPFTFEVPEWIEAIDVMPFVGKRNYRFRAQPMKEGSNRSGIILLKAAGQDDQQVIIDQINAEGATPEPVSVWTFDDENDLLAGSGPAVLRAAERGSNGIPRVIQNPAKAGIVPIPGPTEGNGAITVPINSYLQMAHNQAEPNQNTFTILMDIRPKSLAGYNALFQSYEYNEKDGALFTLNTTIGISTSGLGYGGHLVEGQWHRIVFVVENNCMTAYIDGNKAVSTNTPSVEKWTLRKVCYFFADEDGEEGQIDIAELRYWNQAIYSPQVRRMGNPNTAVGVESVQALNAFPRNGAYDLSGRKIYHDSNAKPRKGLYIVSGKKVVGGF
ncbi:MAG: metallophosphoesterase [Bacteroidaceae bacterium]|nr:metallophosphoesterase [Bacteroidaceae bacterium]